MKTPVIMEKINTEINENTSIELCKGEIPGTRAIHHIISEGSTITLPANVGYYHIMLLVAGKADFTTDGKSYTFDERVTFVPALDKELKITAKKKVNVLEIQWDYAEEDAALIKEYDTEFPYIQLYKTSIQYTDPNKSEKTISRMVIPHRIIPRFTMGSVETYGVDYVRSHAHPMLDQFFFSFPENDMNVLINGEPIPMKGDILMHIPLGADHGVDIPEGKHCHYMWIDFLPDNEKGLSRLDSSHKVTGTMRSFDEENK